MTTYNINYTNPLKPPITVEEKGINTDFSVAFPGRIKLEWGEEVNENLLRLLENFAVQSASADPDSPDVGQSLGILQNAVEGQLWFNKSNNRLYSYDGTRWVPYAKKGQQYAANWGQVVNGEQLPLPVSPDGYVFSYDECIWSVSPFFYLTGFTQVQCSSDSSNSLVTMVYDDPFGSTVEGTANYLIIGIQRNNNLGSSIF